VPAGKAGRAPRLAAAGRALGAPSRAEFSQDYVQSRQCCVTEKVRKDGRSSADPFMKAFDILFANTGLR
jgi:hypothetical protein